jgi:hypothetical protein
VDERTKKAFEFAQQLTVQLITLASGTIAIEVTLLKDVAMGHDGWARTFALISWCAFAGSIICGMAMIATLAGNLASTDSPLITGSTTHSTTPLTIYRPNTGFSLVFSLSYFSSA